MTRDDVLNQLKDIFRYTMSNADEIIDKATEQSNLYTDLGLSSVGMLYIVIAIEEMFKVSFDNVNFGDFTVVKDVVDYILKNSGK